MNMIETEARNNEKEFTNMDWGVANRIHPYCH